MAVIVYFPDELIQLQLEVLRPDHHVLHALLNALPKSADLGEKLEEVAAFCGVKCDGYYEEKELLGLCRLLLAKLRESRGAIEIYTEVVSAVPVPGSSSIH